MKSCVMTLVVGLVLCPAWSAHAVTRHVPADYATIQGAITAAVNGDTVLVAPGTYTENINYRGKNIVVASRYILTYDVSDIASTIINGSQPANSDTGSCVLMISGEDTTAVLEGFTLTAGTGTRFQDQSNFLYYVEGGGIIIENSSPTIAHNWIIGNQATRRPPNTSSAGGGGIRAGWSSPRIENNVIMNNQGRYGGGVVLNFATARLDNNIIIQNSGGQDYGGGGLWLNGTNELSTGDNNVICGNSSTLNGGGIYSGSSHLQGRNFIVWGNRANQGGPQITGGTAIINLTYSCVQGGRAGLGNFGFNPLLADSNVFLMPLSPCVDSGDSTIVDQDNTRSDRGAYGGPGASPNPSFSQPDLTPGGYTITFTGGGPGQQSHAGMVLFNRGSAAVYVDSARVLHSTEVTIENLPARLGPFNQDTLKLLWVANSNLPLTDTLYLYHTDATIDNPQRFFLNGTLGAGADPHGVLLPDEFALEQNFPNPFNASTEIRFALPVASRVKLDVFDLLGNLVTTLLDEPRAAGTYSVTWHPDSAASGAYLYCLRAGMFEAERLMLLVK